MKLKIEWLGMVKHHVSYKPERVIYLTKKEHFHRQGKLEDLKGDYVIFTSIAKEIKPGTAPKIHEFLKICNKYGPINIGSSKYGTVLQDDV